MSVIVIVGAQWGDEGKGKVVDHLAGRAAVVARWNGGDNAGHTVVWGDRVFKFHLLPSGILYKQATCVIGNGVVLNPRTLFRELDDLSQKGFETARLVISGGAHLILPYHIALDGISEKRLGNGKIGTTQRGIGPAYADKASRVGLRAYETLDIDRFAQRLREQVAVKNALLGTMYDQKTLDVEPIVEEFVEYAQRIAPLVDDASLIVNQAIASGELVLCEGAQGTLLDLDHGSYPFVTSSSPIAGGACTGLGIGPRCIDRIIGIAKAYTTRVGAGPFPTELSDVVGDHLVEAGHEYGTTTGRRRRAGWLDTVILRFAGRVNGLSEFCLTKLDVLSGLDTLRICIAYERQGKRIEHFPAESAILSACTPVYEEMPGWKEDITGARTMGALPPAAQNYISRIEDLSGVPVSMISVGPEREQVIWKGAPL